MTITGTNPGPSRLADDDPRALFAKAVAIATDVIGNVRPQQLGDPTPCPEYDVGDLLGHLVTVLGRVAALGRGDDPFGLPPTVRVADDGWLEAWVDAAHDVQAAWTDDAVLTRTMRMPWLEGPGAQMLTSYLNEVTVHTWDLASATGQHPAWDPQVLSVAYDTIRFMPATNRAELFAPIRAAMAAEQRAPSDPFADAVPVPDDAPLIDRLVAWNGRRP
ncbi:MAG: TIGR03086 family metal-binding protein [Actinomycetota bacterium]|nr:TIGR03086 family metal-binding protein [Actinomycetota bacterium]